MGRQAQAPAPIPANTTIAWRPQPGPQTALLECPCDEIFFGGARGGGKTDGMIGEWVQHSHLAGKEAVGVFFRKTLVQLEEAIERAKQIYLPIGSIWREQKKIFIMPNGSRLKFRMLERDADAEKYQGHSYTRVYFEEITNWSSPKPVMKLFATLRSGSGFQSKFMATGNPGGPGHTWVKARYIDPNPSGYHPIEETTDVAMPNGTTKTVTTTRVFIPSKLNDNILLMENDPLYVAKLHQSGSDELVRAWLEGDWDVIDGAFFDEWRKSKHVMPYFEPPVWWTRFRAFDWGSAKPFSVGWWAVSDGTVEHPTDKFLIPRGALIRYNEWYGAKRDKDNNIIPNVGLKMTVEDVAVEIQNRSAKHVFDHDVADKAIFIEDGGPSMAERMYTQTHGKLAWSRSDSRRIPGWDQVRWRLQGNEDGHPMIYIMDNCTEIQRTLPALQHDEKNPEDVNTDAEDHAPDELRYACMSRPIEKPKPPEPLPIKTVKDLTLNEVWDMKGKGNSKYDRI